jgi:hypothetical protein
VTAPRATRQAAEERSKARQYGTTAGHWTNAPGGDYAAKAAGHHARVAAHYAIRAIGGACLDGSAILDVAP